MEYHDLRLVNQKYKELMSAVNEGYQLGSDEAEYMNDLEEEYGLDLTSPEINQGEEYDEDNVDG